MPTTILEWNGTEIPNELRELPPGRYLIEPIDEVPPLTEEEEAGLVAAIVSLEKGHGIPLREAMNRLRSRNLR